MDNAALLDRISTDRLQDLGQQLRVDSVRASAAANSGHPTSSMSAADLMAVLLARHFRYDFTDPHAAGNDHLIFSKGHASPLLDAMYRAAGAIDDAGLLSYRSRGSRLEGHPTPRAPWVDVATGSRAITSAALNPGPRLTGARRPGRSGPGELTRSRGTLSSPPGPPLPQRR
jgi:transketolase